MKLTIASDCALDLSQLVDSRMLINANSGGGKSYLLRLIAEQSAGHVQTLILDPEGEFATLRERFDFLLVGSAGEIPTEVRSASLLARKLLELQASAVIDLYDLKLPDRRRFVRLFLESLMHLPKQLWRPLLIMLDEAHLFCPERSAGEAESTQAVIDLMSQGRKRSYCGILATQRLSKLHKDAEAETNNVFVGRTWLDIDQKRAGALLGMDKSGAQALRDLDPGEYFAFGPAVSAKGIVRLKTNQVTTSHPKAGQRHKLNPPKPSDAVRRIVGALADLPQQADAEVRDLEGAKKRIKELETQLRARPTETKIETKTERVEVPVLKNGELERYEKLIERTEAHGKAWLEKAAALREAVLPAKAAPLVQRAETRRIIPNPRPREKQAEPAIQAQKSDNYAQDITPRQQRFLDAAAALTTLGVDVTRETVAAWVGVHPRGGSVGEELKALVDLGMITIDRGHITVTEDGMAIAEATDTASAIDRAKSGLSNRQRQFFEVIVEAYPGDTTREAIAERFQLHPRGGSLGEDLGRLVGRGLVDGQRGRYRARDFLFAGTR